MSGTYDILLLGAAGASGAMVLLWALQLKLRDATSVDVAWAAGVGILAILFAATGTGYLPRRVLVGLMGGFWALRLFYHLLTDRVLKADGEDGRYAMLREKWGRKAPLNFFIFYQAQALFVIAFGLPFFLASINPYPAITVWDVAGILLWLVAIFGESLADRQLARFRRDPENRGRTCRSGLWGYSRHPNYFFEWVHWWAYVLISVTSSIWWASLFAPLFMLFLLFFVTGIPYTEKRALESRGDDYRDYQRTTSRFVPWFPKVELS